jgi:hypothetical protein
MGIYKQEKKWYTSKTLWVNLLSILAILAQTYAGNDIVSPEIQAALLGIINVILRGVTKGPVKW